MQELDDKCKHCSLMLFSKHFGGILNGSLDLFGIYWRNIYKYIRKTKNPRFSHSLSHLFLIRPCDADSGGVELLGSYWGTCAYIFKISLVHILRLADDALELRREMIRSGNKISRSGCLVGKRIVSLRGNTPQVCFTLQSAQCRSLRIFV